MASFISVFASAAGTVVTLNWIVANAVCPSLAMFSGLTPVTLAAVLNGPSACSIPASVLPRIGSVERMASVSVSPDWRAKCWLSIVWPWSVPANELSAAAPKRIHSVMRQATVSSQPISVLFRYR